MEKSQSYTVTDGPDVDTAIWKFWTKRRYVLVIMCFFGFANAYGLRVNLSVGIVAMTKLVNKTDENGFTYEAPDIDYSKGEISIILSSFFYGYILTQVAGGIITRYISAHIVYGIGIFLTALFTLITPLIARNFAALVTVRIIEGLFEGVTFPCLHSMLSKWAPPLERTRMVGIAFAGNYIGTVISMPLSGILGEQLGWESIFYVFGALGVLWYVFWLLLIQESPEKDTRITEEEKNYILKTLGAQRKTVPPTPWRKIWTSTAVWAIIFAHFSENWGYYTLLTQLPTFLNDVIGFDLTKAGFTSSLPYLTMGVLLAPTGYLADLLITKNILSVTNVRRIFNCGGFVAQCVFMMTAGYLTSPTGIIACLVLGVGLGAFSISGFAVNALDIAPSFAAILMGITNTFATLPGIISPLLTGAIVTADQQDPSQTDLLNSQWKIVFIVSASIYLVGCVVYWFFASGELQEWAVVENEEDNEIQMDKKKKFAGDVGGYDNQSMEYGDGE
ncbi:vesicular glutamate transporter 1-like [Culicoides brevitarsis]|uniref:vesicular glutamate transporter 1-like n=1 Tax=Culicoides brevitarsis TaxID=469753 RepID=UPI00307BD1CD